jgi:hypothetical protein
VVVVILSFSTYSNKFLQVLNKPNRRWQQPTSQKPWRNGVSVPQQQHLSSYSQICGAIGGLKIIYKY